MSDTATTDDVQALRAAADAGLVAQRQVAFLRAGVDVDDPMRAHLMNTYTGETNPDAVKAYLSGMGVTPQKEDPAAAAAAAAAAALTQSDDGQQAMRDAINGNGAAGSTATPVPAGAAPIVEVDPISAAWQEYLGTDEKAVNRNRSEETRQLALIDRYIVGAVEGTPGMRFNQDEWRAERSAVGHDFRPAGLQGSPVPGLT